MDRVCSKSNAFALETRGERRTIKDCMLDAWTLWGHISPLTLGGYPLPFLINHLFFFSQRIEFILPPDSWREFHYVTDANKIIFELHFESISKFFY